MADGGDYGPIHRDFGPDDLRPLLDAAGIERTITVQADNTFAETDAMLAHADRAPWIAAVTGWVPLLDPAACERSLARYCAHPAFRGVRHLVHDEPDPDWLLRESVQESLGCWPREASCSRSRPCSRATWSMSRAWPVASRAEDRDRPPGKAPDR